MSSQNQGSNVTANVIACSTVPSSSGYYYLTKNGLLFYPQGWNSVAALHYFNGPTGVYQQAYEQFTASGSPTCTAMNSPGIWKSNIIRFQVAQSQLHGQQAYITQYLEIIQQCVSIAEAAGTAVILCMNARFKGAPDNPPDQVSEGTYTAWNNLAPVFAEDLMVMFELFNEPNITDANAWQSTFQQLYQNVRLSAPDNVCIIPGMAPSQEVFPQILVRCSTAQT